MRTVNLIAIVYVLLCGMSAFAEGSALQDYGDAWCHYYGGRSLGNMTCERDMGSGMALITYAGDRSWQWSCDKAIADLVQQDTLPSDSRFMVGIIYFGRFRETLERMANYLSDHGVAHRITLYTE